MGLLLERKRKTRKGLCVLLLVIEKVAKAIRLEAIGSVCYRRETGLSWISIEGKEPNGGSKGSILAGMKKDISCVSLR